MADLIEGLGGAIVSPHSQSSTQVFHLVRVMSERGKLHLIKGIIIPEGGGTLFERGHGRGLRPHPVPAVQRRLPPAGDTGNQPRRVAAMNASPGRDVGPAVVLDIEDPMFQGALNGTTHMEMVGTTNLKVFDFFLEWAKDNIRNPFVEPAGRCAGKPE